MSVNQNNVSKVYKHVIDEVIKNVREAFLNDGVDEQVLQELKQIWESKVTQSEAVSVPETKPRVHTQSTQVLLSQTPLPDNSQHQLNVVRKHTQVAMQPANVSTTPVTVNQQGQHFITAHPQYIQQSIGQYHTTTKILVPGSSVAISQQIPESSQTNQQPIRQAYHGISVSPIQSTRQTQIQPTHQTPIQPTHQTPIQPTHQTQIQPTHQTPMQPTRQTQIQPTHQTPIQPTRHTQIQPTHQTMQNVHNQHMTTQQQTSRPSVIIQLDGPNDSDSDDDDDDDDFNDLSHDDDAEDKPQEEDSEPLGPDDDVSDDEDSQHPFETENVVVCQFDRITRSKNKWKFHLKDGIMNLNSRDYVFTKATGEAEW